MQPSEKIDAYVGELCEQIRWKKARQRVAEEIRDHVVDQRDAFLEDGMDEDTAVERAITETGDAVKIGLELDRTHRPKPQWNMLGGVVALLLVGLLMRLFVFHPAESSGTFFLSLVIGLGLMAATYFSDFTLLGKYPKIVYWAIFVGSLLFIQLGGRLRQSMGYWHVYYENYLILIFPLALAVTIYSMRKRGLRGVFLSMLAFTLLGMLTIIIPSRSGLVQYALMSLVLFAVAFQEKWFGVKKKDRLWLASLAVLPAFFLWILLFPSGLQGYVYHQIRGFFGFFFGTSSNPDVNFRVEASQDILRNAVWFGRGTVSNEYQGILDQANFRTDFALTSVTYYLGWVATILILAILLFFIVKGFSLCFRQKSALGLFVSMAIMLSFTVQTLAYVFFNFGYPLVAPISLPLISFGNEALMINLGLIGFMLSVFRTGDVVKDEEKGIKGDVSPE